MEITTIDSFIHYHNRIKQRTRRLFDYIPEDKVEWTYQIGKFTIGDIIRHIANIERYLYAETVQNNRSCYTGCGTDFAMGLDAVIEYYDQMHRESIQLFQQLDSNTLQSKCMTPAQVEITVWKWLRALVEHEIHHRGQLYMYLSMLNVQTPPIFGLTSEEVIRQSLP